MTRSSTTTCATGRKRPPSLAMPQPGGPLRVPGLAFASLKPVCVSRVTFRIADLTNPILKPWAIEEMREQNALAAAGKRAFEARASCRPGCVPGFLIMGRVNPLFFVQGRSEVLLINEGGP